MFEYEKHFGGCIERLKQERRYRIFRELSRNNDDGPVATWHHAGTNRPVTIWCGNDYLGMGQHPTVLQAMHQALDELGAGAGGTRNISGTHRLIVELEGELALLHRKEAALVFTSGYVANETALSTLTSAIPNFLVLSDEENHASMIEGMRRGKAERKVFRHNDLAHLEELLKEQPLERPKLIAFESVYSMSGDFGKIRQIVALAKRYGALTYLDETHAVGLYGDHGGGVAERDGLLAEVDFLQGGLGKGYGVIGGFVTGSRQAMDVIRSYGSGFIFTTALPPAVAAGALASIRHLRTSSVERAEQQERVRTLRGLMVQANLPIRMTSTHIIPFIVGDSALCSQLSESLLNEFGIYIQPINYPTVPRGTERLRITPSPLHSDAMMEELVSALEQLTKRLGIKHSEYCVWEDVSAVADTAINLGC